MSTVRNWAPKRHGAIYCSSACGGGCTWAAYRAAKKAAKDLCARMDTSGWEPRVHENLGWHWGIVNGLLEVWPASKLGHYLVGFTGGTPCEVHVGREFKDPNDAVKAQKVAVLIDTIQTVIDSWAQTVDAIKKSVT